MKQKYFLKIAFCFLLISTISYGQLVTTIDFESVDTGYTPSATEGSTFIDVFNRIDRTSNALGGNNTFLFAIEDTNLSNPSIDLDQIDVTGSASFTFSIDMLAHHYDDWDDSDELLITYSVDGGGYQNLIWVQNTGDQYNAPAALDLGFDEDGDCGSGTTLPAISTGTSDGCTVSSNQFATFVTNSITLTNNSTLDIKLQFNGFTSGDEGMYFDNIIITETAASSSPTVTFDSTTSSETETDVTFATSGIPITLTNYDADVTVTATVNGSSTAEVGDYTIDLTPLVFDANETLTIPLSIKDDIDSDDETIVIEFTVTSGTADLGTSTHTVTITDDELPVIVISEIMYNTPSTDDEWIEVYNGNGADVDISNWTVVYSGGTFTFPGSTTITDGDYITIALGSNGDGTYNNDNPFTPDFNDLTGSPSNANVKDTNDSNNLGNSSGTITLKNSSGTSIDVVDYDDGDASSTDGNGPSYEILDTTSDNSNTNTNWQASALNGGSPGKLNSTTWSGATNNDWNTTSNWSNGIPVTTSDLLIPASLTNYPTASGAVTVNSVVLNSGASLIAQGTFTGTVTYNRNIPTTNWYLVSSPVAGQDIDTFVAAEGLASGTNGSNLGLSDYNNATPGWTFYQSGASGTGSFTSGDGRSIKLASTGDVSFTGTINTSDVTVAMTSNSNGFNLLGNPYPSYVAGNENADGTNNILTINSANLTENTLWFWNQSTDSYNQINQASAAFQIAPAQGFFLSATGSVNLSITEAMQSHQGTDSFQRLTTRPKIVLTLSNGTAIRNADIYYIEGTTTGWNNGYDSSIFGGVTNEFAIYTHAVANGNGRNLGIQSLPPNNYENMIIPVGINAEAGTSITIDATTNSFPEGINIYLEDKQDNSFTLLEADSNFSFTPENNLDGIGRFYLHTTSGVLSANDFATNTNISIYTSSKDNLRIAGVQNGTATVRLYNILGKEVLKTSFVGSGVNDIKVNAIPVGIYIVKLTTENGTLNRKIIIQ